MKNELVNLIHNFVIKVFSNENSEQEQIALATELIEFCKFEKAELKILHNFVKRILNKKDVTTIEHKATAKLVNEIMYTF